MGGTPDFLQSTSGTVVKSVDGGTTFAGVGVGLPNTSVSALCIDPRNSMQIFAATSQGVFVSLDGGASWAAMNSGLTDLSVQSLAIDPLGEYIHAGTGSGVFDFQLASPTCAKDSHTLCLNGGRFSVSASFSEAPGALPVQATAVPLTNDTGYFWFFDPANVEMVAKVLPGCALNGEYWVFAGGLTNVGVEWRAHGYARRGDQELFQRRGDAIPADPRLVCIPLPMTPSALRSPLVRCPSDGGSDRWTLARS